jgi:hypothetical protein
VIHELIWRTQTAAPAPTAPARHTGFLQRACACAHGGEECEECHSKRSIQRHSTAPASGSGFAAFPQAVHETLGRRGSPLDPQTREFMGSRFGHDFSRVRVHTDEQASESARAVHAHAYTVGSDIAFRRGLYAPATSQGRALLAHELAHVVQQGSGTPLPSGIDGGPSDALEVAADAMAKQALAGHHQPIHRAGLRPASGPLALLRQKAPAAKHPTHADIVEEARAAAYLRVQVAYHRIQGAAGPGGPPGAGDVSGAELAAVEAQLAATRLAQVLLDWPNPDLGKIESVVSGMLTGLRPAATVVTASAGDPRCDALTSAYVKDQKPPIYLCPNFFNGSAEERIRHMIHESAHAAGIGQAKGESYCVDYDCATSCGGVNAADSWAHYVNCLSGQPADVPDSAQKTRPAAGGAKPAPKHKP